MASGDKKLQRRTWVREIAIGIMTGLVSNLLVKALEVSAQLLG
ncbi:DUF6408 family protein [Streptomyces sp. NBC_00691]|nr:DUF6408 family protein [Streptomyces sp. NBC_00691]